ncbi:hypothetical protein YDYSY3_02680 [Paenibacillus chitinolyticus]|uniref:hypothetical protein n=1 Tax=Paenibacillus chitinolyticus TaxID=79263 RepID=UPI0026E4B83F|nr:hypothetical protein [Paenibacillus chitinolyticus]GKS09268.1 hypothetical protein YDYSY3_02680 [Paenibacillus chitinolyticus]
MYYIVGAYLSQQNSIVLNATATNQIGLNASTNRYTVIDPPYTAEEVGTEILKLFQLCLNEPDWKEEISGNLPEMLGYKTRSKFNKAYYHVIIQMFLDRQVYEFTPMKKEGSGYINNGKTKVTTPFGATKDQIGEALLDVFKMCK